MPSHQARWSRGPLLVRRDKTHPPAIGPRSVPSCGAAALLLRGDRLSVLRRGIPTRSAAPDQLSFIGWPGADLLDLGASLRPSLRVSRESALSAALSALLSGFSPALGRWLGRNRAWTLPSRCDTPLVRSTMRRSPRMTCGPCVITTLPFSVTVLVRIPKTKHSPVAVWSFWLTRLLPLASSRRICCCSPGPPCAGALPSVPSVSWS